MNIFVVDTDPKLAAQSLPDKHVVKMILESAQMLSIVYSRHYWNIGQVLKVDGTPFKTQHGAFKNHPCTKWVAESVNNCEWLLQHALGLCEEFRHRYGKSHGLEGSITLAHQRLLACDRTPDHNRVCKFARAMPDDLKLNTELTDVEAYRQYLNTKEWVKDNYLKDPSRKPNWINQ
jgi:hypothetical protein